MFYLITHDWWLKMDIDPKDFKTLLSINMIFGEDVEVTDKLEVKPDYPAGPWVDPDPEEFPFVLFHTKDYLLLQKVFDEFECRQAIRDTGAILRLVHNKQVRVTDISEEVEELINNGG